jgi:acetyltransferase
MNYNKKNNLDTLFYPKSIALIGASNNVNKIGGFIFSNIKDIKNIKTYPINVKWNTIQGKKAYPNVLEIPDKNIDLAIIAVKAELVNDIVEMCGQKEIKNVVIISAGFKEIGEEGIERENKLKEIIKKYNINLVGPNCLGFLNPEINLNCSFAKDIPNFGDIAFVSQSGAVIDAVIDWSFKKNIGFSKIISVGNMAGISEVEYLEYLKNDPKTKAICFYIETLSDGEKFEEIIKETAKEKPIIILKPGFSKNAQKAIGSHTGSFAQDNILVKTLIEEAGGIFVNNLEELFNTLIGTKFKPIKNNKIVIVTNAGGPGVVATDEISKTKLELRKFTDEEKNNFYSFLPKEASINNPIDIIGDAKSDRYINTLKELDKFNDFENILILLTPQIMTDTENIAKYISEFSNKSNKNIVCSFIGNKEIKNGIEILDKNNIPNYETPSSAIKTLNKYLKYFKRKENNKTFDIKKEDKISDFINKINKDKFNEIKEKIKNHDNGLLDYNLTKEIFNLLAIHIPNKIVIKNPNELNLNLFDEKKKYVLKVDSKNIIHKKDLGGVILNIDKNQLHDKVNEIFNKFQNISDLKLTIEEQVENGFELIIGLKEEKNLGKFLLYGWGGIYTNVIEDFKWFCAPINLDVFREEITNLKITKLLNGFRGTKISQNHLNHLYEIINRVSYLQYIFPEIKEVDLNPIIINDTGVYLVDIKLIK